MKDNEVQHLIDSLNSTVGRRQVLKTIAGVLWAAPMAHFTFGCSSKEKPLQSGPSGPLEADMVLFVPGVLSQFYEAISKSAEDELNQRLGALAASVPIIGTQLAGSLPHFSLPIPPGGFVSFYTQMSYFPAHGMDYEDMSKQKDFDTQKGVEHNAAAMAAYLGTLTGKRVILVSHSKGGLDTLHALISNPHLQNNPVVGWVALQAPFHGSPIADAVPPVLAPYLLAPVNGSGEALTDLQTSVRGTYMTAKATDIERLVRVIPISSCYSNYTAPSGIDMIKIIVSLVGNVFNPTLLKDIAEIVARNIALYPLNPVKSTAQSVIESVALIRVKVNTLIASAFQNLGMLDLTNRLMSGPNDGLVPESSTKLSGTGYRHIKLADGDHAAPVMIAQPFKQFWSTSQRDTITYDLMREVESSGSLVS